MKTKIILALSFLCFINIGFAAADEVAGKIVNFEGIVKIYEKGGIKSKKVNTPDFRIYIKDKIKTYKNSKAFIVLSDQTEVILKEQSTMTIEGMKEINTESGIVLFNIKKKKDIKGFLITSKTVVIGVKGTKFIVDNGNDNIRIFLKEGSLNVRALKGEFTKYVKKEAEEFNEFSHEFDKYKEKVNEEFKEFIKEFEMGAGTAISVNGNEVRDIKIPDNIYPDFKLFEAFGSPDGETDTQDKNTPSKNPDNKNSPPSESEKDLKTGENEKTNIKDDFFDSGKKSKAQEDPFFKEEENSDLNF